MSPISIRVIRAIRGHGGRGGTFRPGFNLSLAITIEHMRKSRAVSSVEASAAIRTGRAWSSLRIPELDGIRGFAILGVLLYHYIYCQVTVAPKGMGAYLLKPLTLGWAGVDLFFALSGFLIAGILMDNRQASSQYRHSTLQPGSSARGCARVRTSSASD